MALLLSGCLNGLEENGDPDGNETTTENDGSANDSRRYELDEVRAKVEASRWPEYEGLITVGENIGVSPLSMEPLGMSGSIEEDVEFKHASFVRRESAEGETETVFWVALINQNDEAVEVEAGDVPPYRLSAQNEDGEVLRFVPTEDHGLAEDEKPESFTVPADDWALCEYGFDADGSLPTGMFEFSEDFTVWLWDTRTPGPMEETRFTDIETPTWEYEVGGETVENEGSWFHDADRDTETYYRPESELVEPPATVGFELVNRSEEALSGGTRRSLYKLVDGDWFRVAVPEEYHPVRRTLPPGWHERHSLAVRHGGYEDTDADTTVGYLGGGVYAYTSGVSSDDGRLAALFKIDAPDIQVEADDDAEVEQGETTVKVTVPSDETSEFVVRRVEGDVEARRIIPEQMYASGPGFVPNYEGLRNAVPFFENGVEEAFVRMDSHSVNLEEGVYEYNGMMFRLSYES